MKLSVILPTYNEAGNIVRLVRSIMSNIPQGYSYEIVVVDDNSPDQTYEIATKEFAGNSNVKTILRTVDRGLAKSIRAGIELSSGDKILVMDTDFTHDPAEIPKLVHLAKVFDLASGSRFCPGGNMDDTFHYIMSLVYNWFIRIILRTQIQDNLGGFFILTRSKIISLPLDEIFYGYGDYFFRLLFHAQKQRMSIIEMPAHYSTRTKGNSKSNFKRLLFLYTRELIKVRIRSFLRKSAD